jgi:hypothetical protein
MTEPLDESQNQLAAGAVEDPDTSTFVHLNPPPSAKVIASTHDALARRTQSYRDQGRSLEQIIEIFSTAWPELHYHPSRRAEVERAFNSPKISEHPSEDEIALAFVASVAEYTCYVSLWGKWLA